MAIEETRYTSRKTIVIIVYLAFVFDNVLLTVVVPILPEYLARLEEADNEPIFSLPAVVVHHPHLIKAVIGGERNDLSDATTGIKRTIDMIGGQKNDLDDATTDIAQTKAIIGRQRNDLNEAIGDTTRIKAVIGGKGNDLNDSTTYTAIGGKRNFNNTTIDTAQIKSMIGEMRNDLNDATTKAGLVKENQNNQKFPFDGKKTFPIRMKNVNLFHESDEFNNRKRDFSFKEELSDFVDMKSTSSKENLIATLEKRSTIGIKKQKNALVQNKINVTNGQLGRLTNEYDGEVGPLLAARSLVQLLVTPLVAKVTREMGYSIPLIIGCCIMLASTTAFACSTSVLHLALARSLHGVASSCIAITGLGLVATMYEDDVTRSKMIGLIQGGVALGVVLGYPMGGLLYQFTNSPAPPFFILAGFVGLLIASMIIILQPWKNVQNSLSEQKEDLLSLIKDKNIAMTCGAVLVATSSFPVLESCLPTHLRATIQPERWELGAMFLPDSIGYFTAASLIAAPAYKFGRSKAAAIALVLVSLSTFMVPFAGSVGSLTLPHLGVGIGVGTVDAAMLPLLATYVDTQRPNAHYGTVYALAQGAVAGAYCIGPLLGVWISINFSFTWTMRALSVVNLLTAPLLLRTLKDGPVDATISNHGGMKQDIMEMKKRETYETLE